MPIFRVKSVKIYTGQKKFTLTPSVASVTIIRYDLDQKTRMPKKFILHIGGHQSIFRPYEGYGKRRRNNAVMVG